MNVTIIGAGSWGSGLARILGDNGNNVLMFDTSVETVKEINETHTNSKLPNGKLPLNVSATIEISKALDFSDVIILCVPTKVMRVVLKNINNNLKTAKLFVNASKGLEPDSLKRVSEVVKEEIDNNKIKGFVALTGPSHAEEVIEQMLTMVCSVSENIDHAKIVQQLFNNTEYFRVYTSTDLIGAELCGAIKNVYAIASGLLEGLGYGDNAKAALITRALVELKKIVVAMGGEESTISGLTGVGDLIVTATSHHSRNFQAGLKLATGADLNEAVSSISMVVEGARTAEAVYQACQKLNLDCPIIDAVYNIIYNRKDVKEVIKEIMCRSLKEEI